MQRDDLTHDLENFFSKFLPTYYEKRDLILQAGDTLASVFFIKSGYVRVYRISEEGEELTLTILKPGDLFPMTWGVEEEIFNYYLEAITRLEVCRVPRRQFMEYIKERPEVFYELISFMSMRVGGLLARIEYLVTGHAYTKVAATVLACARRFGENQGSDIIIRLPLTHRDIATLVGITRETTCLEMKKLEKKGLIAHKHHLLVIKDIKRLEEESLFTNESAWLLNNSL